MKVLLHALGATMGGAIRHLSNFLPELGRQDSVNQYAVLVRNSFPEQRIPDNIRIERISDRTCSSWLKRLIIDNFEIPAKIRDEHFHAIVSLTNYGPIKVSAPHIFFQRNSLYYCPHYLSIITGKLKYETMLRRRLAVESMKRAVVIVTPSNAMADMIKETCVPVRGKTFKTLYHGFNSESLNEPLEERFEKFFQGDGYKLFYPTHPAPHKGFEVLFEGLAELKRRKMNFILYTTIELSDWPAVVQKYIDRIKALNLEDRIVFTGRIPQNQMGSLYQKCDLMVYPSLCESFGFSMIEAIGYNLPIVAADTPVNREMCHQSALFYEPLNPGALADAVETGLQSDVAARLIEEGKKRLSSFDWSWQRYTREFLDIIHSVTGN